MPSTSRNKLKCQNCGDEFDGNEKFCNNKCRDEYILKINTKVQQAVKDDKLHTKKISEE